MGNFALAFIVVFSVIACEAGAFARDDEVGNPIQQPNWKCNAFSI